MKVVTYLDKLIDESGSKKEAWSLSMDSSVSLLGRMLGFAHKLTKDEKYKKALLRLIQREGFNGNFCCEIFYSAAPFFMLFETEYNNKEGYNRKKSIQGN